MLSNCFTCSVFILINLNRFIKAFTSFILVVDGQGHIRFRHPNSAKLDCGSNGHNRKYMQFRKAMAGFDSVQGPSDTLPKQGERRLISETVIVGVWNRDAPYTHFVSQHTDDSLILHRSA